MNWVTGLEQARKAVTKALADGTSPDGQRAALLRRHGSMTIYFYEPRGEDRQRPHDQDEVYFVVSGSGTFAIGDSEETMEQIPFGPGDAIFTPAEKVHRFEDFTDDFGTWVLFWGPSGGESD